MLPAILKDAVPTIQKSMVICQYLCRCDCLEWLNESKVADNVFKKVVNNSCSKVTFQHITNVHGRSTYHLSPHVTLKP